MLPPLQDLWIIVGITLLCMISPGPDMALVMRNTLVGARIAGLSTSAGVLTGNFVHITYCALGVGFIVANSVIVYGALRYTGALYLLVLGIQSFRTASAKHDDTIVAAASPAAAQAVTAAHVSFVQGLLNNLLNPKSALFYLGVFSQVIRPETSRVHAAMLVAAMVATSALFWVAFVALLAQPWMRGALIRSRSVVERVFGALLIALGLRVALRD